MLHALLFVAVAAGDPTGNRTADGIDDQNWFPRKDTAGFTAFDQALQALQADPEGAPGKFVDAASKSPGFYAASFDAGVAAEASGDLAAAEKHYRASLASRPDFGLALANLQSLLSRTGRDAEAAKLVDDALRAFPNRPGPHLAAATRAFASKDMVKTEEEARAAMREDERNVGAMLLMARVFRAQARMETARFAVDNALALEPGNALLHFEKGQILLAQNERKEAALAFEKTVRLNSRFAEAQEAYGVLLLELGFPTDALKALETVTRLQPNRPTAYVLLGNAQRALKDYSAAEASYKKALSLDANNLDSHFNLGVLYVDNALPGVDELARWKQGLEQLKLYSGSSSADANVKRRADEYIDATEKRIAKEGKRREREEKRKADEAAAPKEESKPEAPADPPPAADAKPPEPGAGTEPSETKPETPTPTPTPMPTEEPHAK